MKPHCDWDTAIVAPNRRALLAGLACAAVSRSGAQAQSGAASADDVRFMRMAIDEARQADFPFGAVIVRDGSVIARGRWPACGHCCGNYWSWAPDRCLFTASFDIPCSTFDIVSAARWDIEFPDSVGFYVITIEARSPLPSSGRGVGVRGLEQDG